MPNALARETSPYLLQHKDNPVDWVPWGDLAFRRATDEDKLVFLSIGYSTCHWCHVMEHESFENEAIAALMNEHFVCVKVDREERPDIDSTYMAFLQATTGSGGWPMSVWLTPDGKPVVGGTYFPPEDRGGRAGFPRLCSELGRLWKVDRKRMQESAEKVMAHLSKGGESEAVVRELPGASVFLHFIDRCESIFDHEWGGWGGAPKFPRPVVPRLLLQLADRFGKESKEGKSCLSMVQETLWMMASGGMCDQLGGGFHRYSVDRYWHIPHYEKMLYDQGQIALLYLEAWQVLGEDRFREIAVSLFEYVLSEMTDSQGGFHAAEDADSLPSEDSPMKKEGAFWTWTAAEIYQLLEPKSAGLFCEAFGVEEGGNARDESDPHGELRGQNTLFVACSTSWLAERFEMEERAVVRSLQESISILREARAKRVKPHRDDKVVAAWNGWMIAALARGARVLDDAALASAAVKAAGFMRDSMISAEGKLQRSWRGKNSGVDAFAVDLASVISGLLELCAVDPTGGWLEWALELQDQLDGQFWDEQRAAYVMRSELGGQELMTMIDDYDGAEPAANHLAAENLLRFEALTGEGSFGRRAEAILHAGAQIMEESGFACPVLIGAYDLKWRGVPKMEIRGELHEATAEKLRRSYLPGAVWTKSEGPGEVIECRREQCQPWLAD
ncbi:MAG: thioredoxin domain-containing protein [Verrucomicrobiales bacterium]